jgi:hypothetical protein
MWVLQEPTFRGERLASIFRVEKVLDVTRDEKNGEEMR